MEIVVTNEAQEHLREVNEGGKPVRIVARDTYECSTMVEYFLATDESKASDQQHQVHSIPFIYDQKAEDEIGDYVKIDYISSQGIKLLNRNQTLAYGLMLKSGIGPDPVEQRKQNWSGSCTGL